MTMKYIKLFEEMDSMGKIGKKNLLPWREKDILDQIELYKMSDRIYAISIVDARIRAFLFLRYQEFYEGTDDSIRGHRFNIDEFINWYTKHRKSELFTYQYDWSGFNIPSSSIEDCLSNLDSPNEYDRIMQEIVDRIRKDIPDGNFYLLGVDKVEGDLLEHEMAHGLYFTNPDYKNEMNQVTNSLPDETKMEIIKKLLDFGYPHEVIQDEIQAYISTGLDETMVNIPNIDEYKDLYEIIFREYLGEINPIKIQLDFK